MPQVILVDDNIKTLDGLQRHIPWHATGCVCVGTAHNGVDALALCRSLHPDVVITDVKMPQMDGIELCRQLHADYPDMHLIVLSAYDDFGFAQQAMAVGVSNYLLKPINDHKINEITTMLSTIAQRSHQHTARLAEFLASRQRDTLAHALLHGHSDHVEACLAEIFGGDGRDVRVAKEIATHLVALLYHQAGQIGGQVVLAQRDLSACLRDVQMLQTSAGVHAHVRHLYQRVCQHIAEHRNPTTEQLVQRIQHHIEHQYANAELSTSLIAQRFHISQSYLCQIFRTYAHTSIHAMIMQLRIERACVLLGRPERTETIAEVSRQVGYADAQYFTKVFRRIKGLTPSEYRDLVGQSCAR